MGMIDQLRIEDVPNLIFLCFLFFILSQRREVEYLYIVCYVDSNDMKRKKLLLHIESKTPTRTTT